jgi:hypothetical protein
MPALSQDTDLLREAWAVLSSASGELIRFHKEGMPVFPDKPGHDEWEACGCEVAVTIRELARVERKLYTELERRGVFS